jgi:hypothetical protein
MKNKITFSHNYPKLWGQKSAELLAVRELKFPEDKNKDLIFYDTQYAKKYGIDYYPLRNGDYIQLIFIGDKHIPFCTLRPKYSRWQTDKLAYYKSKIGQEFNIIIEDKSNESLNRGRE